MPDSESEMKKFDQFQTNFIVAVDQYYVFQKHVHCSQNNKLIGKSDIFSKKSYTV